MFSYHTLFTDLGLKGDRGHDLGAPSPILRAHIFPQRVQMHTLKYLPDDDTRFLTRDRFGTTPSVRPLRFTPVRLEPSGPESTANLFGSFAETRLLFG